MITVAELLERKQILLDRRPPNEHEQIEALLSRIDEALELLDEAAKE